LGGFNCGSEVKFHGFHGSRIYSLSKMVLFNYFNHIAKVPSIGKIETKIKSKIGEDIKGQKTGEYLKFSDKEKDVIAKYASKYCVAKAIRHFQGKSIKENSVRDWKRI